MLHDLHIYILNFCDKTLSSNSAASLKVKKYLLFLFRFTLALLDLFLFFFGRSRWWCFELGVLSVAR